MVKVVEPFQTRDAWQSNLALRREKVAIVDVAVWRNSWGCLEHMKELEEPIQLMNLSIRLDYYAHSCPTQLGLDFRKYK
jgi:hypothetical protein